MTSAFPCFEPLFVVLRKLSQKAFTPPCFGSMFWGMSSSPLIVLIDGACPLCNRSAAWFARRNCRGGFIFGKNTGEVAKVLGEPHGGDHGTIVVWQGSRRLVRSTAVLTLLRALGGGWQVLAALGLSVPRGLRDGVYDFIAQRRHRLSGCSLGARLSPLDLAE